MHCTMPTDGDNWNNNTNWKSDKPLDQWYGVRVGRVGNVGRVNGLLLTQNQLTGEIPVELGNLANLEALFLDNNNLTGSIPPAVCSLFLKEIRFDYYWEYRIVS